MPIDVGEYYDNWRDIKEIYETRSELEGLRKQMLKEVFDDSKQLKEHDREFIYTRIEECRNKGFLKYKTRVLTSLEISELMMREEGVNLNKMSHQTIINLIRQFLQEGLNVTRVFVDTVGPPQKLEKYLTDEFQNHSNTNTMKFNYIRH
jgi:ribonuclease H2 subunit A